MKQELTHKTLGALSNGAAGLVIDEALKAATGDLENRGHEDGKPRVVTITVAMAVVNKMPVVTLDATTKLPPYRAGGTLGELRRKTEENETFTSVLFEYHGGRPDQPQFDQFEKPAVEGEVEND